MKRFLFAKHKSERKVLSAKHLHLFQHVKNFVWTLDCVIKSVSPQANQNMRCIELHSSANRVRGRWIHRSVRKHCPKHLRSNCKWSKSDKNIFYQLIISECKKNLETCKPPSFHSATAVWPVEAPIAQAAGSDYQSWLTFGNWGSVLC